MTCQHRRELDPEISAHHAAHPEMICAQCWVGDVLLARRVVDPLYQVHGELPRLSRREWVRA